MYEFQVFIFDSSFTKNCQSWKQNCFIIVGSRLCHRQHRTHFHVQIKLDSVLILLHPFSTFPSYQKDKYHLSFLSWQDKKQTKMALDLNKTVLVVAEKLFVYICKIKIWTNLKNKKREDPWILCSINNSILSFAMFVNNEPKNPRGPLPWHPLDAGAFGRCKEGKQFLFRAQSGAISGNGLKVTLKHCRSS